MLCSPNCSGLVIVLGRVGCQNRQPMGYEGNPRTYCVGAHGVGQC